MIKIYGKENCRQCEELKSKLINDGAEFEYIEDIKELRIVASKAKIMSAPIIEYNNKFFTMDSFLKEVK
ncbi:MULTISPECIES: glutaredoxin family protein [Psychrilyobacter]|uniref:Glutaredoxin family protein n=1 Tax=Psychrilyobacter piezotolerans TaxID=2293438 RepID=A0ABX9KIY0_9FUSO|nr:MULTISPECIES: glutaredoxin family protein [Psychrilyobacter]MCS5421828.1 glutaredoxin family protein [Psychrilyobacter sp. S5]NDI77574.1 glutaredoxin family protein [Psychrilyobacter piezotolerans]RDE62916.1 glutaredoxin family protein [Psychrilyobacter sp. S5]REI41674.1 glutaredoxin family protein [Psychrilyobacter piezotolerans]